jgi:fatty-acyl-CoA synthase
MVIRGGENIYPREIEEFLHHHETITDVYVVGVPDRKYGEELCAWVKVKDSQQLTDQDVKEFCKGKIAHYKIPRYVMFVNDFPMSVSGKIQKFRMREESVRILGLHEEEKIETA